MYLITYVIYTTIHKYLLEPYLDEPRPWDLTIYYSLLAQLSSR